MNTIEIKKENGVMVIIAPQNTKITESIVKDLNTIIDSNVKSAIIEIKKPTELIESVEPKKQRQQQKDKLPNSCYSVKFNGVVFNSSKMLENYTNTIKTLIQRDKSIIPIVKNILGEFAKTNLNDFTESTRKKAKIYEIADNLYLSTYSGTIMKKTHLEKISQAINVPITLEKIK